jgi:prevent-host-death family protein
LQGLSSSDYNGRMIKTLRESKAKLSELVERASQGEDVLITVRGKVKARLTRASQEGADMRGWAEELAELDGYTLRADLSAEDILDESRQERV